MKIKANLIKVLSITSAFLTSYGMEHNPAELNDTQSVTNIKENEEASTSALQTFDETVTGSPYCGTVTTTDTLAIHADPAASDDTTLAGSGSISGTVSTSGASFIKKGSGKLSIGPVSNDGEVKPGADTKEIVSFDDVAMANAFLANESKRTRVLNPEHLLSDVELATPTDISNGVRFDDVELAEKYLRDYVVAGLNNQANVIQSDK